MCNLATMKVDMMHASIIACYARVVLAPVRNIVANSLAHVAFNLTHDDQMKRSRVRAPRPAIKRRRLTDGIVTQVAATKATHPKNINI